MNKYTTAPNGEVFTRQTTRDFTHAIIWTNNNGTAHDVSWHGSLALAKKTLDTYRSQHLEADGKFSIAEVTNEAHGPCGRCHQQKELVCSVCRGTPNKEDIVLRIEYKQVNGRYISEEVRGDFHCTCKTGKRKCHVCKGKGQL